MYRDKILRHLIASTDEFISGSALAGRLNITRAAVWKHIQALGREGFIIEATPSKGYRLTVIPDLLFVEQIKKGLKSKIIGKEIVLLPETGSTNTRAMEMAAEGADEGTVVIAETQSAGKGRLGRTWYSPKRNIYLSLILRPEMPPHRAQLVTLMGAVAVVSAIQHFCGIQAGIKWPNDILLSEKKAAGLLTEMRAEQDRIKHIVLGIGLNVNVDLDQLPVPLRATTTSLSAEAGKSVNRNLLVQHILFELENWYLRLLKAERLILEAWESFNVTVGKRIVFSGGETLTGVAEGIDPDGRLILKQDDGTSRFIAAGDVTILKR